MTKIPLPIPACLLLAVSLFATVVMSRNASYATSAAPITIPTSTLTRVETAMPTDPAPPTRRSTSLPDEAMLSGLEPEHAEPEMRPEIAVRIGVEEYAHLAVPTPPPEIVQPPALVGKALVVDQGTQMLHIYEDGVEIRAMPASTGVPPLYTPAFLGHIGQYASTIYGYGERADDAWYVFTAGGDIYIHGAPYTLSDGTKVYAGLESLGARPSSHGCIRLHPADAEWLTMWDPRGVPILITPLDLSREW